MRILTYFSSKTAYSTNAISVCNFPINSIIQSRKPLKCKIKIFQIFQDNEDEEDEDEEVLEPSPVEYRPPTPPKASPKTKEVELPKTLPKLLFENSQEIGPSPKLVMQNKRGYFYAISQKEKLSPRLTPKSIEKVDLLPKTAPMVTPTLFMPVTEDMESHTPTPPQLSTIGNLILQ